MWWGWNRGYSARTNTQCVSYWTIKSSGQSGGIVGKQGKYTSDQVLTCETNVTGCTNAGYVLGTSISTIGGITGYLSGSTFYNNLMNNNTNVGYVDGGKQILGQQN